MIFPLLNGLVSWKQAPVAWALFVINFAVFCFTSVWGASSQRGLDAFMRDSYYVSAQGQIYARYLEDSPEQDHPLFIRELGKQVREGSIERTPMLGQLAFRDFNFMRAAEGLDLDGDQVALRLWKKRVRDVRALQEGHPSFLFGLNADDLSMSKWLSYIFVHSGWLHFAGNMLFLLIFGAALERQIGGLGFLMTFLLSGTVAAGVFATMTGVTTSPLVGASGAISGAMTLYCVLNWGHAERYFYWFFLPFRGFMGFVYLPAWVAMILWFMGDLAGYIGTLPELGGVAHTAHLGGELAGVIMGLVLHTLRRFWPVHEVHPSANLENQPMGVLIPFLPAIVPRSAQNHDASYFR